MTNEDIQRNLLGEGSNTVTAVMVDIQIEYLKQHFLGSMAFLIGNINRLFIGIAYYQCSIMILAILSSYHFHPAFSCNQ